MIIILNMLQHNTIIIDLKDTIIDLQTQIKNNNNHNDYIQYYILVW